ncbi:hypothetical protein AAHH80_34235, partial [Burkholderia pseudomallei]
HNIYNHQTLNHQQINIPLNRKDQRKSYEALPIPQKTKNYIHKLEKDPLELIDQIATHQHQQQILLLSAHQYRYIPV